jgi:hypothetical protein
MKHQKQEQNQNLRRTKRKQSSKSDCHLKLKRSNVKKQHAEANSMPAVSSQAATRR